MTELNFNRCYNDYPILLVMDEIERRHIAMPLSFLKFAPRLTYRLIGIHDYSPLYHNDNFISSPLLQLNRQTLGGILLHFWPLIVFPIFLDASKNAFKNSRSPNAHQNLNNSMACREIENSKLSLTWQRTTTT